MRKWTKCDVMLPVGWTHAHLTLVWKFLMMKKCIWVLQESLESSSKKDILILSAHKIFWLSARFEVVDMIRFVRSWRPPCRQQHVWSQDGDRRIRETLTLMTCADSNTFCTFLGTFFLQGNVFLGLGTRVLVNIITIAELQIEPNQKHLLKN